MPLHLDFGPTEAEGEPITFTLHGRGWAETFTTLPDAPSGALSYFVIGMRGDGRGGISYDVPALIRFIQYVLRERKVVAADEDGKLPDDLELSPVKAAGVEMLTAAQAQERGFPLPAGVGLTETVALVPADDVDRFSMLLIDKDRRLPPRQLAEVAKGLAEAFTGRPTAPSTS